MPSVAAVHTLETSAPGCIVAQGHTADDLSDALLDHMLDCSVCINSDESGCATWQKLQAEIKLAGQPKRALVLAL